jgi:hypothetical protein
MKEGDKRKAKEKEENERGRRMYKRNGGEKDEEE